MFTPVELDLTPLWFEGADAPVLEVVVWPAPKYPGAHRPKAEAARSCKPAVSYGWDWHPRLIPLGIWDDVVVEDRVDSWISDLTVSSLPNAACTTATVSFEAVVETARIDEKAGAVAVGAERALRWTLTGPDGRCVRDGCYPMSDRSGVVRDEILIENPELWWPNGQGAPSLYTSTFQLEDDEGRELDVVVRRHGIRRVRLVMNEDAWEAPAVFPKSRSFPPFTLEINGRRVFAKGSNWVNPEVFPGVVTPDTYQPLLEAARDANFNILRAWGGAPVNKDAFYEQCDALGLMVWQEFPSGVQ